MSAKLREKKFVLLRPVGPVFDEGDVVQGSDLYPKGFDVEEVERNLDRLQLTDAIREATPTEAGLKKVTLPKKRPPLAVEEELRKTEMERDRLRAKVGELTAEVDGLRAILQAKQPVPGHPDGQEPAAVALAKKDQHIMQLEARIRELESQGKRR